MVNSRFAPQLRLGALITLAILLLGTAIIAVSGVATAAGPALCPTPSTKVYRSGPISVSTVWDASCTWVMYGNVTVMPAPVTLTIQPGASVLADPGVHLYIRGTLLADGLSGARITFGANRTGVGVGPWGGIQFNSTATGSVSNSTIDRADRAVTAIGSAPSIHDNTVLTAGIGFAFLQGSTSVVQRNTVRLANAFGVYVNASAVQVLDNAINNTAVGIQVEQPAPASGRATIARNNVTNVSSGLAAGILVSNGAAADISGNTIRGLRAVAGANGAIPGANGRNGGFALGVFANTVAPISVVGNTIDVVLGGNGGNGRENTSGNGGRGGDGGSAGGIVVAAATDPLIQGNTITNVAGGRGGVGGGTGSPTVNGGRGGNAAEGVGIEVAYTTGSASVWSNAVSRVTGGSGGTGGQGTSPPGGTDGSGGLGGDGYGLFLVSAAVADASANTIQTIRGGFGGNTSAIVAPNGNGARGGEALGIAVFSVVTSANVDSNVINALTGGTGGHGRIGGNGGNGTGVVVLGNNDGLFNATTISWNQITTLTGGTGGDGPAATGTGGDGGTATGIGTILVSPTQTGNTVSTLRGGNGDNAGVGGRGGDASGVVAGLVLNGWSSGDSIDSVTKGAPGTGGPPKASYANGYYLVGNATSRTRFTAENATILTVGSFDFYVDNYTEAVALNTPFTTESVQRAGNLTVQNFLEVQAMWPDTVTMVAGARVRVDDNAVTIWDRVAPSGDQMWILVTDRIYINSNVATENKTTVTVTYSTFTFLNDPRTIPMDTSHQETFVMRDQAAPTSAASTLPAYENSLTFSVHYRASDGNGTGLGNITLWYRIKGGSGGWARYATQRAGTEGAFTFTATADGLYEFATTADDTSGNVQPGPNQNNTWTIVDTTRPASHVVPLPRYETSSSFVVTWAPDSGVADVATYTIQYNSGTGWVNWLVDTSATSGTFTNASQIVYQFRAIAKDRAGNVETTPSGNDTWTLVDSIAPSAVTWSPTNSTTQSPIIQVSFSEPMNRTSVEAAFSVTPGVAGTFSWSADSRVFTFVPNGTLAAGTTYTVVIGTGAKDTAGNGMQNPRTFQFATAPVAGLSLGDFWWLLPILGAVLGGGLLLLRRQRAATPAKPAVTAAPPKSSEAIIEDVFLLYHRDGILIKHETRRLRPDIDTDILTGMLTAVQQFVKDALRGDETADLNEMTVGHMHILIGRGKWLILAARIEGDGAGPWTGQIERCIKDMEDHHWDQLEDWDGDMALARVLMPYLKKLIQGAYALVEA